MNTPVIGVFEGGGIKGIALAGAAAATLETGYGFDAVVGTSAGALVGSLVAAGYTSSGTRPHRGISIAIRSEREEPEQGRITS